MKYIDKIIQGIFALLIVVATLIGAVAVVEPTITNVTTLLDESTIKDSYTCAFAEDIGTIICVTTFYTTYFREVWEFDPQIMTLEPKFNLTIPNLRELEGYPECDYRSSDGFIYCIGWGRQYVPFGVSKEFVFRFNSDGSIQEELGNTDDQLIGGQAYYGCDFKPNDDNYWYCWGGNIQEFNDSKMRRYNVATDTWENLADIQTYANQPQARSIVSPNCLFLDNEKLFCSGGFDITDGDTGHYFNSTMIYDVDTNTTQFDFMPMPTGEAFHFCRIFDDTVYCYAGDDWNDIQENVWYYDPSTDTYGTLNATVPIDDSGCASVNATTDYCFAGYTYNWDWNFNLFKIDFGQLQPQYGEQNNTFHLTPYTPTHSTSAITGLAIDIPVEMGRNYILYIGILIVLMLFLLFKYLKDKNYL